MDLRNFLDEILMSIGATTLDNDEFNNCLEANISYSQNTYDLLKEVLEQRGNISNEINKLKYLFLSRGVWSVRDTKKRPVSNILIGKPL